MPVPSRLWTRPRQPPAPTTDRHPALFETVLDLDPAGPETLQALLLVPTLRSAGIAAYVADSGADGAARRALIVAIRAVSDTRSAPRLRSARHHWSPMVRVSAPAQRELHSLSAPFWGPCGCRRPPWEPGRRSAWRDLARRVTRDECPLLPAPPGLDPTQRAGCAPGLPSGWPPRRVGRWASRRHHVARVQHRAALLAGFDPVGQGQPGSAHLENPRPPLVAVQAGRPLQAQPKSPDRCSRLGDPRRAPPPRLGLPGLGQLRKRRLGFPVGPAPPSGGHTRPPTMGSWPRWPHTRRWASWL